jgi:predicted aldo/keto reductase-like oxidoreductase
MGMGRRGFMTVLAAGAAASCSKPRGDAGADAGAVGNVTLTSAEASAPFPRRRLGHTDELVSIIGIGGAHLGRTQDDAEAIRIVRGAIDHGIDFMDNSWDYNGGVSEERMGRALQDGYRQRAFLMTKLDGRTKKAAAGQLEQSLRRLRTDAIDLVQIHEVIRPDDPARVFAPGGAIEALVEARNAGKLRYIGFTGHKDPAIHLSMLRTADDRGFRFDTVQMPINAMDWHYRSFEKEVLPVLTQKDIAALGMKSMGDGFLLNSGVITARECLRYSLSAPVAVLITGIDRMEILEQALDVGRTLEPMTSAEREAILARTAPAARSGAFERFKTSAYFDSTAKHPEWLEQEHM